jgi:hypothetical protein
MDCKFKEKILLYHYRELNDKDRKEIEQHITLCKICQSELKILSEISKSLNADFEPNVRIEKNILSLFEKFYAYSFSLAIVFLFLFTLKPSKYIDYDIEDSISKIENELSYEKYDSYDDYSVNDYKILSLNLETNKEEIW